MKNIDEELALKIDELISKEYIKNNYNDGEGYSTTDLNDIIEILISNHTFTSKDSVKDLIIRLENMIDENRYCSECAKSMKKGYCIENGLEYYCSDECLHKHYTNDEYIKMYDNGNGDSYYTEWEC